MNRIIPAQPASARGGLSSGATAHVRLSRRTLVLAALAVTGCAQQPLVRQESVPVRQVPQASVAQQQRPVMAALPAAGDARRDAPVAATPSPSPRVLVVEPREPGWRRGASAATASGSGGAGGSGANASTAAGTGDVPAPGAATVPSGTVAAVSMRPNERPLNETLPGAPPPIGTFGKPAAPDASALAIPVPPVPAGKPEESGIATVYSNDIVGELTASGERYAPGELTAAHRTLPIGTVVRVVHVTTGRVVKVRINDRWGGGSGRIINLSRRAADELGFGRSGQLTVDLFVESVGTGPTGSPTAATAATRMPELVDSSANPRYAVCANQGKILGLRDQYLKNHMANCLARPAAR